MRLIVGISLILLGLGTLSCQLEDAPPARPEIGQLEWVRTASGWERPASWCVAPPAHRPQLHPLVVALGQGLASIWALAAFGKSEA